MNIIKQVSKSFQVYGIAKVRDISWFSLFTFALLIMYLALYRFGCVFRLKRVDLVLEFPLVLLLFYQTAQFNANTI